MNIKKLSKVNPSVSTEKYNSEHHRPVNTRKDTNANHNKNFFNKQNKPDKDEYQRLLEKTIDDYNKMLDKNNKDLYIFYENISSGFLIKVADIHTSEIKFQHEICIECIKSADEIIRIINDFINDKGLLIDFKA